MLMVCQLCRCLNFRKHEVQRRGMAGKGPFPHDLSVVKNKYIEEWNGSREITELDFEFNYENAPTVFLWGLGFPLLVYWLSRSEHKRQGHRQFEDML
jgi:hypothetical protein